MPEGSTVTWELSATDAVLLQCALSDSWVSLTDRFRVTHDPKLQTLADVSYRLRQDLITLRRSSGHLEVRV